ncbi:hypothetical protein [Aquimarina intermedia]|uniref:Lipoprotein n=1 Tax=Aquimarina intermedia TaxID=350814 RepID=A0A5S5CE47_9FLAO|nr:hypothetical protein [Aquimarina intermedia]TYP76928.1 hypothetical protein BD809_10174 [Aquimarina intermedia]
MKKILILCVSILAIGLTSCGSDDDAGFDCLKLTTDVSTAASAYAENQTTENCNAYKQSLEAYLEGNCFPDEQSEASFREQLEGLTCS